jgi:hypothetical protein
MRRVGLELMILVQALVYGAGLLIATGLVMQWGEWYTQWETYRVQSSALQAGQLSLSQEVGHVQHNHTWSEGGVHQVWGLGVPLWRMPWDRLAQVFGHKAFPDRLAFGLFAALVAFVVLRVWTRPLLGVPAPLLSKPLSMGAGKFDKGGDQGSDEGIEPWPGVLGLGGVLSLTLLFPPLFGLLQSGGPPWNEPVAYQYFYAMLLLTCLVAWMRRPGLVGWAGLGLLAGLGGFIRPPLMFYGMVTLAFGTWIWLTGRPWRSWSPTLLSQVMLGWMLFAVGGGLLWWTNLLRFGDGFEFGHRLNLSSAIYATRFAHPFQDTSLVSAARELFGALFLTREFNGFDFYREGFFPGQADAPRWRHFFFRTYDLSYGPWLLAGWGWACWWLWRRWKGPGDTDPGGSGSPAQGPAALPPGLIRGVLGGWSLAVTLLLTGFYLWVPVLSSRYLLDFAPAWVGAMLAVWLGLTGRCHRTWSQGLLGLALIGWLGLELHMNRALPGPAGSATWAGVMSARDRRPERPPVQLSDWGVALGDPPSGIPYDRTGWDAQSGVLQPLVVLFAKDPDRLELELEVRDQEGAEVDPEAIQAKIGLETLERVRIERNEAGWRVRFAGPRQERYRAGIQVVFLATVPKERMLDQATPWVLKRVKWREPGSLLDSESADGTG